MEQVDAHFLDAVTAPVPDHVDGLAGLDPDTALGLFDSQLRSRHLDLAARLLRARGAGFYTIGSAGHEGNAAVAAALRVTDPALPHYRSGAFYLERARAVPGADPVGDVLKGLVAATDEPIAGGRHKVFGHPDLAVLPQTSTIASHLPRALGTAFALGRAHRLGVACPWPADAVVMASFGDASANHSTATGAINAAVQVGFRGLPLPLLLVCEDNGLGISVPTPDGWIAHAYGSRPGLAYFAADGLDLPDAVAGARAAADWVRTHRRPAFLHLRTVRLMGHAGTDLESAYRTRAEIERDLGRDPLLGTARRLIAAGVLTPAEVTARYERVRDEVVTRAEALVGAPQLTSAADVMAPLAPHRAAVVAQTVARRRGPRDPTRRTLAQSINATLNEVLRGYPNALVFGEDVAHKGGVYGVTKGLAATFGSARVFDTLLDEQTILGLALGAGVSGLLPVPEIQYLAYLHNAEDQLRGEAASLRFFSAGAFGNPLVLRLPGYGYQRGFGGHFHNDDAVGVLRDIPGLVIASPARPDDAAAMLRTCVAAADTDATVSVFLEPIALYHTRDLHEPDDGGWLAADGGEHVGLGEARSYGEGTDLTIVTWANGLYLSLRAARTLAASGIGVRVLDLRWLAPLPVADLLRAARATGRVLVVDETRRSGGVSEGVLAALVDAGFTGAMARVTSADSFVPLGDAARLVLVSEADITASAQQLVHRG